MSGKVVLRAKVSTSLTFAVDVEGAAFRSVDEAITEADATLRSSMMGAFGDDWEVSVVELGRTPDSEPAAEQRRDPETGMVFCLMGVHVYEGQFRVQAVGLEDRKMWMDLPFEKWNDFTIVDNEMRRRLADLDERDKVLADQVATGAAISMSQDA